MSRKPGFVPLASSVLSSESEAELREYNFNSVSNVDDFGASTSCINTTQRIRRFSFSSHTSSKRSRHETNSQDRAQQALSSDEQLERILLQPLHTIAHLTPHNATIMSLADPFRSFDDSDSLKPFTKTMDDQKLEASNQDDFFSISSTSAVQDTDMNQHGPNFFDSTSSTLLGTPRFPHKNFGKMVSVHELANGISRESSMQVKGTAS